MTPSPTPKPIVNVMAEDEHEDREFAREAFGLADAVRAVDRYWLEIVEFRRDGTPE